MPTREQLMQVIQIQTEIAKLGLDLGGVMQYVVEQTLPLIGADGAAIELVEDDEMVYRAAAGIAKSQLGLRLKINESLTGLCVMEGSTLSCDDSESDPRVDRLACRQVGLRSMIVMPLKHKEVTVGALKAMSAQPGKFIPRDMALLGMLSEVVAAAMYFSVKYDSDSLFIKATHDGMTGLANRALFMDRLRNAVARTHREKSPSGLLMIDMDGLKQINDTHGHRIGDAVIIEFSHRLKQTTRGTDTAARLGGDEFGVILTPLESPHGIDSFVQRIDSAIKQPFVFEDKQFPLKASIGSALIPRDGGEPAQLLEVADQRMYAVKHARKRKH
ncbi:MAG: GGDEF domain-containing protein [Burkholderiales bacterium 68-12]|nr:MAG: GGDEF domain-containing protein [Burkholderiales bacterium 68-12]